MLKHLGLSVFTVMLLLGCAVNNELLKKDKVTEEAVLAVAEAKAMIAEATKANAMKYAGEFLDMAECKLLIAEDSLKKSDLEIAVSFAKKSTADAASARDKALAEAAVEKAYIELKLAQFAKAGDPERAKELYDKAGSDLSAAKILLAAKDYEGTVQPAVKAYEEAAEARRLCELIDKATGFLAAAKTDMDSAERAGAKKRSLELFKSAAENYDKGTAFYKEKDYLKAIDFAGKASDAAKAAKAAALAGVSGRYTVKNGDSLWNISKDSKVFDNPFLWPLLYKNNREKIKDPDWIYPEQEFELPGTAGDNEKKEAVGDAFKYKKK